MTIALSHDDLDRHRPRKADDPVSHIRNGLILNIKVYWIPAFAGMTRQILLPLITGINAGGARSRTIRHRTTAHRADAELPGRL